MKKSAALKLLTVIWESGKKDSWQRINSSMRQALSLAIKSGLNFNPKDFSHFANHFRWEHWVTESHEWIYADAIINLNDSCTEAYEKHFGRQPFRANGVSFGYVDCFLHANSISRQRERLSVGASFPLDGYKWHVTSFDDSHGLIRAVRYQGNHKDGKPKKLRSFTHDEITELFPSPEKFKKQSKALLTKLQEALSKVSSRAEGTQYLQKRYGKKAAKLRQLLSEDDWRLLLSTKFSDDKPESES